MQWEEVNFSLSRMAYQRNEKWRGPCDSFNGPCHRNFASTAKKDLKVFTYFQEKAQKGHLVDPKKGVETYIK
jgi:hypothetical protein